MAMAHVAGRSTSNPMSGSDGAEHVANGATPRLLRRKVLTLIVLGVVVQVVLSAYYLSMAHSPSPHDLPVGYVATDRVAGQVESSIEDGGSFTATRYADTDALVASIKAKETYGGVDVGAARPHLYIASAAGVSAATAIRTAFTAVVQDQTAQAVKAATDKGQAVPAATVQDLAAPPAVTDVVPLPDDDRSGTSLAFLIQALVIGATVASTGLGRIGPLTRRSMRRGVGHVATLVAYAAASAAAVLIAAEVFGVIPDGTALRTYLIFLLLSLAVTGSVAGLVALVGEPGRGLGTVYFVVGLVISGASVLPEFLPTFGRVFGQVIPPGAGATAIRDSLYFPDASIARPVVVLGLYAAIGLTTVLVSNALANRTRQQHVLRTAADAASER